MTECLGTDLQNWDGNGAHPQKERCQGKRTFPDKRSLQLRISWSFGVCGTDSRMRLLGFWTAGSVIQERDETWRFPSGIHHYSMMRIKEAAKIVQRESIEKRTWERNPEENQQRKDKLEETSP